MSINSCRAVSSIANSIASRRSFEPAREITTVQAGLQNRIDCRRLNRAFRPITPEFTGFNTFIAMIRARRTRRSFVLVRFLDEGLDQLAAGAPASVGTRIPAIIGVGLIALAFEPWPVCAVWTAVLVGVELWSLPATRAQYLGLPVTTFARLNHLGTLISGVSCWFLLGLLFWRAGSAAGAVCAVAI